MTWDSSREIRPPAQESKDQQKDQQDKQFGDNLNIIKTVVDNKKELASETLNPMLNTSFLGQLEKNKDSKKTEINDIYDKVMWLLVQHWQWDLKDDINAFNKEDLKSIKDLQDFLKPYVYTKSDMGLTKVEKGTSEKYNNNESILAAQTKLESLGDIPADQKALVKSFLDDPSKENIQNLQKFILEQSKDLTGFNRVDFYKWSWDKNFKGAEKDFNLDKKPDWKFWTETLKWFEKFMDVYNNVFKDIKESADNAKKIALGNEAKQKNFKVQVENTETKADAKAQKWLDQSKVTYTDPEQLNKKVELSWDKVKYRGEEISALQLAKDLAKSSTWMSTPLTPGLLPTTLEELDQVKLDNRVSEIDKKLDKSIVTYDEKTNTYQYRWGKKARDEIWDKKWQITLEQFQNEVDKKLISKDNEEKTTQVETSKDKSTTREVVDFKWDRWHKITTNVEAKDWSTETVDLKRWERSKVITTETDAEWNVINKVKEKEDADSFKEKAKDKDLILKDWVDEKNLQVVSADEVLAILQKSSDVFATYDISKDWQWRININFKDEFEGAIRQDEDTFLNNFESALTAGGIVRLDMKDYKFKWEKYWEGDGEQRLVNKMVFDVWPQTQKEIAKLPDLKFEKPNLTGVSSKIGLDIPQSKPKTVDFKLNKPWANKPLDLKAGALDWNFTNTTWSRIKLDLTTPAAKVPDFIVKRNQNLKIDLPDWKFINPNYKLQMPDLIAKENWPKPQIDLSPKISTQPLDWDAWEEISDINSLWSNASVIDIPAWQDSAKLQFTQEDIQKYNLNPNDVITKTDKKENIEKQIAQVGNVEADTLDSLASLNSDLKESHKKLSEVAKNKILFNENRDMFEPALDLPDAYMTEIAWKVYIKPKNIVGETQIMYEYNPSIKQVTKLKSDYKMINELKGREFPDGQARFSTAEPEFEKTTISDFASDKDFAGLAQMMDIAIKYHTNSLDYNAVWAKLLNHDERNVYNGEKWLENEKINLIENAISNGGGSNLDVKLKDWRTLNSLKWDDYYDGDWTDIVEISTKSENGEKILIDYATKNWYFFGELNGNIYMYKQWIGWAPDEYKVKKDGKYYEYSTENKQLQEIDDKESEHENRETWEIIKEIGTPYQSLDNQFGDYINSNTYKAKKSQNDNIIV